MGATRATEEDGIRGFAWFKKGRVVVVIVHHRRWNGMAAEAPRCFVRRRLEKTLLFILRQSRAFA
jgi:hypothetical protein